MLKSRGVQKTWSLNVHQQTHPYDVIMSAHAGTYHFAKQGAFISSESLTKSFSSRFNCTDAISKHGESQFAFSVARLNPVDKSLPFTALVAL